MFSNAKYYVLCRIRDKSFKKSEKEREINSTPRSYRLRFWKENSLRKKKFEHEIFLTRLSWS